MQTQSPTTPASGPVTYTAEELRAHGLPEQPVSPFASTANTTPAGQQAGPIPQPKPEGLLPKRETVDVKTGNELRPLIPTSLDEAYRFARMMASGYSLPDAYYTKPKKEIIDPSLVDTLNLATSRAVHAIQLGLEVGLPPAQALQSILVLNGVGTIWGDAQLALVRKSGLLENFREYTDGGEMWENYNETNPQASKPNRSYAWVCEVKRKGDAQPVVQRFSIADAIHAGLWGKKTWATHPGRMGRYKVRAFVLRDTFGDVLKGLTHSVEEFDGEVIDVTPNGSSVTPDNPAEKLNAMLTHQPAQTIEVALAEAQKQKGTAG